MMKTLLSVCLLAGCTGSGASQNGGVDAGADASQVAIDAPLGPLSYTMERTAGGCDQLDASATTLNIQPYIHTTDVVDLPWTFPFYAATMTELAVTDWGQLLLFTGGSHDLSFVSPARIPSSESPNGFIAPFWTTRLASYNRGTVHTGLVGDHLTVEWTDFYFDLTAPDATSHVTFQAKLYHDGSIETAYCTMTPNANVAQDITGARASIGIESPDGLDGVSFSFFEPGAVDTSMGIRFTAHR